MRTLAEHNEWRARVDDQYKFVTLTDEELGTPGALVKCDECNTEMLHAGFIDEEDGNTAVKCPSCGYEGVRRSHLKGKVRVRDE